MAKYRITSIPQAKKGKIVKSDNTPMVEVQGVQQPSYWNDSLPGYMKGEGCPPGKYDFNGECLTETEYIAASNAEMNKEQADYDTKNLARRIDFVKQINDIYSKTNEERARWEADHTNRYLETVSKSKKQDKIEPYKKFPETEVTPELEAELKNDFLVHKKDGFVELFPKNIVQDRIITNGFQADQFKNYWGLDPEQVKEQLGDLMGAAKANYEAEVTQNILTKAIEQGKPVDQVIKGLSPKLGQQSNLKATFEKPTNKIINDAFSELYNNIDSIPGSDASKVEQDRKIFLESSDPMDAWERKYHSGPNNLGDFLTYQSKKIERGEKAYSDWMDKYGKSGQYDGLTFAKDDAMANVRNTNMLRNQTLNQKNAFAAASTAKAEDFNKAAGEYVSNLGMDTTKQVLKQALDAAGSNSKAKLEILKSFQEDPNDAMQKLLGQKTGNKKQTYNDVLNDRVNTLFTLNQNRDKMKQGTGINENTTGSKIQDVLKHPFDAAYFAMNPREEMWGNSNKSYRNKKADEKRLGVDLGTMPTNVMSAFNATLQPVNPFKIGDNLRRGYDEGNFLGALGDELVDVGTVYGLGKGFNALGKLRYANRMVGGKNLLGSGLKNTIGLKKGLGTVLSGLNNPLMNAGLLALAPENFSNAYDELQAGNYGYAAFDGLLGTMGVAPAFGALKTLNSLRRPGTVLTNPNLNTQYTGMYNAATPGSGIGIGNPGLHTAQPVFQSVTNPLNKLSKGLGFGEFSVLKQNPKGYFGTGNYPLLGYSDGGLVQARTGMIVKGLQALGKNPINVGRMANIGTIGTVNSLVKSIAPIMIHPLRIPLFGATVEKMGPFTGSPLNALPFYGNKMNPVDGTAFRKFGDSLDYVKMFEELNPSHGPLLRKGKTQIMTEGNWAEPNEPNENYSGVFGAQFDKNVPGSDLGFQTISKRNGVLVTDALGNRKPIIPLSEPGLSFHRRLPFSNRYIPVNMDKLRNDEFDWRSQGGNLQSLIERYGYGAAYAAALAAMGMATPQEYLDEYVTDPIKKVYNEAEELFVNPLVEPKRKEGGLVKANLGRIVKSGSDLSKLLKPTSEFRSTLSGLDDVGNLPALIPNMRNVSKPLMNSIKLPLMDSHIINLTQSPTDLGGTSLIKFGNEPYPGDEWYNIDPADYQGLDWKKEGLKDANDSINKYLSGLPQYGKDTFKGVGDFDFKDFSDGWEARQAMMNIGTGPQWAPGKNDFYTENELTNLVNQQSEWQAARNAFDDMNPEDPGMAIFSAFSGNNSREELFSNLFPNVSMPNFRSKFTTPSQEALLQQHLPWQYSVRNQGMLNPNSLKNINGLEDRLPRTYQDLLKAQEDNYFVRAPAKDVVMEMRGGLGLKIEDIKNATPEQLEKWRKQIVQKMNRQVRDRWTRDLSKPFTGGNAFKQISDVPGWKNKKGGVVTRLSKKEIDQYVKDGYIIEDE